MAADSPITWKALFETKNAADSSLTLNVLKKNGETFLLLPLKPHPKVMELYPAQSWKARLVKRLLTALLRLGLPIGSTSETIPLSLDDPFSQFLISKAGDDDSELPELAILCGNPHTEGRRFILLLFFEGYPEIIIKVGIGEKAKELIRHELDFLKSLPPDIFGIPGCQGAFSSDRIEAFTLDYVEGDSPRGDKNEQIATLLGGWVRQKERVRAIEIPAWKILEKNHSDHPLFIRIKKALQDREICPALFHGDFAPWNIKESPTDGSWTVLDWERGGLTGFPAWDWFHYVTQTGILVEKMNVEALLEKFESLIKSGRFLDYAKLANISGIERMLFVGYLFYHLEINQPSEGADTGRKLLQLAERFC